MRVHVTLQHKGKGVARLHWGLSCPSSAVHAEILGGHTAALSCGFHFPLQHKQSTHGLVAMTSASHAEGRQFDPGQVYVYM